MGSARVTQPEGKLKLGRNSARRLLLHPLSGGSVIVRGHSLEQHGQVEGNRTPTYPDQLRFKVTQVSIMVFWSLGFAL